MSYEVYVYSERETVVTREELAAQLRKLGCGVAFVADADPLRVEYLGPVGQDDFLAVWLLTSPYIQQIEMMLSAGNRKDFEILYHAGAIGTLALWADTEPEFEEELVTDLEPRYADFIRQMKMRYTLHIGGAMNAVSLAGETTCAYAIARLTGGLFQDEQQDMMQFAADVPDEVICLPATLALVSKPSEVPARPKTSIWNYAFVDLNGKQKLLVYWLIAMALTGACLSDSVKHLPLLSYVIMVLALAHVILACGMYIKPVWALVGAFGMTIASVLVSLVTMFCLADHHLLLPMTIYTLITSSLIKISVDTS